MAAPVSPVEVAEAASAHAPPAPEADEPAVEVLVEEELLVEEISIDGMCGVY